MSCRWNSASWLAAVFWTAFLLQGCSRSVERIFDCASADGEKVASFYRVFGGGAAGWQLMRVSLRREEETFEADDFIFEMSHGYDVRLEWSDSQSLVIGYPDTARVEKKPGSEADSVAISLRMLASVDGSFADSEDAGCFGSGAALDR